jgi:tRNA 2-thiouridine synthesizing protein A
MKSLTYDQKLDTSGLVCPWPLIKTKQILAQMSAGKTLLVISTDPSSLVDFKAFVAQASHDLLQNHQEAGKYYYLIKKNEISDLTRLL